MHVRSFMTGPLWQAAGDPPAGDPPAGDPPAGDPPAGDPPASDPPAGNPPAGDPPAGDPWFKSDKIDDGTRDWLTRNGLAAEDMAEVMPKVLAKAIGAEKKLGGGVDTLMAKPAEGQGLAEYMKANADVFGIPDSVDGYEIKQPKMAEGLTWDADLEGKVKDLAFEHGVPPAAVQSMVDMYAGHMGDMLGGLETQAASSMAEMMSGLSKDWGAQTEAKVATAQRAMQHFGQMAGLDNDTMFAMSQVMSQKAGDANIMRMFAAIGDAMGEDAFVASDRTSTVFGITPADARAQVAKIRDQQSELISKGQGQSQAYKDLQAKLDPLYKIIG